MENYDESRFIRASPDLKIVGRVPKLLSNIGVKADMLYEIIVMLGPLVGN